jgi:hypothetical protein
MAKKKVIPGSLTDAYKKREGDFSPDLVGFQLTKGTPLFTLGNFGVTTNTQPKTDRTFQTGQYSSEFTLNNLNLTQSESERLVTSNINTILNLDPKDISKFVYYGSFVEYLRVNVESIITNWKGSLYVTDIEGGYSTSAKYTVLGYSYDLTTNQSTFKVPTLFIQNKFDLTHNDFGGLLLDAKDISNIKLSYSSYEIFNDYGNFSIVGYTGSTDSDPYLTIVTEGETFPTLSGSTFGTFLYHVKPKDTVIDILFFDSLNDFENILLDRLVTPKYTCSFESVIETESGGFISTRKSFTWPTTDGYNIDIEGSGYSEYLSKILKTATDYDRLKGNLMTRRFISDSIQEFDTEGDTEFDTQGRKINKLLTIYGREFDEVKKYTDSIRFANVVTYDKRDNTPDELIKSLAKTLGFDTIKSVSDNELLSYIAKANQSVFEGHSRDMSTQEIDTELWRRLVINAWWLFKSKGTRKVIEFFINLFGLNECIINFDEYIYLVKDKLNIDETFSKVESILSRGLDEIITVDRSEYPVDEVGFPKVLPNTQDYYFQMDGFWYNGGTDITVGNNPHSGPYDYGSKYFEKFSCFINDFSGYTGVIEESFTETINLFTDYNNGSVDSVKLLPFYGDRYANDIMESKRVSSNTQVVKAGLTSDNTKSGDGSLKISFNVGEVCSVGCPTYRLDQKDGTVGTIPTSSTDTSQPLTRECCSQYGFTYTNNCYWCLDTVTFCDMNDYVKKISNNLGIDGLVELSLTEGIITKDEELEFRMTWAISPSKVEKIILDELITKYDGYCVMTTPNYGSVNQKCCEIRGGSWVNIQDEFKCVTIKEVVEQPDPCLCELPNYCEYKTVTTYLMNGLQVLTSRPITTELQNYTASDEVFGIWRQQQNNYLKSQNQSILTGGGPGSTTETTYWNGTEMVTEIPSLPQYVVTAEFWTNTTNWQPVNISNSCPDLEYYGWVSDGGFTSDGLPTGQAVAPTPYSDSIGGFTDGDIVTTDYEDILTTNRERRNAALKAKNVLMLSMLPFFYANDYIPYYQIDKCKGGCGKDPCG